MWDGKERRKVDRRDESCLYPFCSSAKDIKDAHDEMRGILGDLKEGQNRIYEIALRQQGVLANLDNIKHDVEDLKKKVEEKLSKKDALIAGSIIIGALSIIEFLIRGHELLK